MVDMVLTDISLVIRLNIDATGHVVADTTRDVLKVVVIDRHHATPNKGIGYVRGFGLKEGAIAFTTNCEVSFDPASSLVLCILMCVGSAESKLSDCGRHGLCHRSHGTRLH